MTSWKFEPDQSIHMGGDVERTTTIWPPLEPKYRSLASLTFEYQPIINTHQGFASNNINKKSMNCQYDFDVDKKWEVSAVNKLQLKVNWTLLTKQKMLTKNKIEQNLVEQVGNWNILDSTIYTIAQGKNWTSYKLNKIWLNRRTD